MSDTRTVQPRSSVKAVVRPPGSKSLTNRALVCAALADGESRLTGVLDSDDTRVMRDAWRQLGVPVKHDAPRAEMTVIGGGGKLQVAQSDLFVENSGTSIRFLAAALATCDGVFRLDGVARMRQRPMRDLLGAIRQLGGAAQSDNVEGTPPLTIGPGGMAGGSACVPGAVSSQFLSGLLMAAPYARTDVSLSVEGELVSRPYVDMTLAVMKSFGVDVRREQPEDQAERFVISSGRRYQGVPYAIEPDASAASYFWAAAAVAGGSVKVLGLGRDSLQGDVGFADCLARMGCEVRYEEDGVAVRREGPLRGVDVDMNHVSDTAQTLAVVALFAEGETVIRGVAHNRHKETDRIGDLARELRKLGAEVVETDDGLIIRPAKAPRPATIATYDDHRMAMSFAIAGFGQPGVVIQDPGCTSKTYPRFFEDLDAAFPTS